MKASFEAFEKRTDKFAEPILGISNEGVDMGEGDSNFPTSVFVVYAISSGQKIYMADSIGGTYGLIAFTQLKYMVDFMSQYKRAHNMHGVQLDADTFGREALGDVMERLGQKVVHVIKPDGSVDEYAIDEL